ncbi:uncharacterized protein F5891DRAFT_958958, partial [Suillus fuscotomentosus]
KPFHFSSHPKRKNRYQVLLFGLGVQGAGGPMTLPIVEDVLFKAFVKARLVDETGAWIVVEKRGRTDRGVQVNAAGQAVSLWVRSALPEHLPKTSLSSSEEELSTENVPRTPNTSRPRNTSSY